MTAGAPVDDISVVSAHDWMRGISLSILASMIGGASKLAIRKSWLIHHANGTQQQQNQQQPRVNSTRIIKGLLLRGIRDAYEEVFSPKNNSSRKQLVPLDDIRNSDRYENEGLKETSCNNLQQTQQFFTPLEVSPRQQSDTLLQDESFSDCENSPLAAPIDAYFFSNNDCNNQQQLITANSLSQSILSPNQTSWLLYLSGMIGMSFLNPLCCVLAMKYANPSILAPFSGLTLVWVILFSGVVVNEFPGRSQKMACALIVLGEILVALFGDHTNEEDQSVDDVISSYQEPAFYFFIIVMTLYLLQLSIIIWMCPKQQLLKKVAFGSIGGSITGFQNFLKDALTIFDATIKHESDNSSIPFTGTGGIDDSHLPSIFFLFVLLAILTSFIGLLCLASCMKRYDATYSAAMFVVSFVISTSLMSCVHYHTFEHLDGFTSCVMYPMGLATLFAGAFILVKPNAVGRCVAYINGIDGGDGNDTMSASNKGNDDGHRERLLDGEG